VGDKGSKGSEAKGQRQALAEAGPARQQALLAHGYGTTFKWQVGRRPAPRASTLRHNPCTFNPTPYALHPKLYTITPTPYTPTPYTPTPYTLHPEP
jgi:hypothetical protein